MPVARSGKRRRSIGGGVKKIGVTRREREKQSRVAKIFNGNGESG